VLRITSGIFRGRQIQALPGNTTRPTSERLRQAWLNALQTQIPEARVLDLFSGSGALGFEALSRGASYVLFVEENFKAAHVIRENIKILNVDEQTKILQKRAEQKATLLADEAPFDLIFMDPPYEKGFEEKILATFPWEELLVEGGRLCIESAHRKEGAFPAPVSLAVARHERYGDTQLTFYERVLETRDA
jgi:16S rRNA (guanine966-N2)-methyltransferase